MKPRKKYPALISFDLEEFDLPLEYHASISPDRQLAIAAAGTAKLLDMLEHHPEYRVTFFVTVRFAEACPELVARMAARGHEIASHGMTHSRFSPEDLAQSRERLSALAGAAVTGFRPPRLLALDKQAILAAGYRYESALNPVWLPGRYNNFRAPLAPFREPCGLWQIPVTALPKLRLPLFWLSFKNLPLRLYLALARRAIRSNGVFNFYTHPWEYTAEAREKCWRIPGYITRGAGDAYLRRLETLCGALSELCEFSTFQHYLEARGDAGSPSGGTW